MMFLVTSKTTNLDFFSKLINYGVGIAKVAGGVAEGLSGNPAGFVTAGQDAMGMVKDKIDGRL